MSSLICVRNETIGGVMGTNGDTIETNQLQCYRRLDKIEQKTSGPK